MSKECRVIIIDEENDELLKNEQIDVELADTISGIVEDGGVDTYEGCEVVCNRVSEMLSEAGIEAEDLSHDEMLSELEGMRLVKKENGNGKKVVKKGGNGEKKVVKAVKKGGNGGNGGTKKEK